MERERDRERERVRVRERERKREVRGKSGKTEVQIFWEEGERVF